MKSLFLLVYLMAMLAAFPCLSTNKICLPCSERFFYLCKLGEKEFCVSDKNQLNSVLNKNEAYVKCKESKTKEDETIFLICLLVLAIASCCCLIALCNACASCFSKLGSSLSRRPMYEKDLERAMTRANKTMGTSKEEKLRRSLFKKNIDATLSREELIKLANCIGSVGIIFCNKTGHGTAVRVGPNFILTCWHVIEPIVLSPGKVDLRGNSVTAMDLEPLKKTDIVNVVFSENTSFSGRRFGLKPKVCFLDKKLDICILELDADRKDVPVPIDLFRDIKSMGGMETNRFVHVVGQHPDTSNIVIDPGCEIILQDDIKVKSAKKWIKKNKQDILRYGPKEKCIRQSYDDVFETDTNLILDTFLEFGASGGAVITFTQDGGVALVAILMRGLPAWFWNERSQEYGFPSALRLEVGCLITLILGSNEWTESERNRIFEFEVKTEDKENMDIDENDRKNYYRFESSTSSRKTQEIEVMDTDTCGIDNESFTSSV